MKSKLLVAGLLGAILVGSLLTSAAPAATAKMTVVGTDPAGDWGQAAAPDASLYPVFAQLGDSLGQDLTGAMIGMKDAKTVNFMMALNSLPPNGGVPEVSRYTWDLTVDGKFVELDGKWSNYSRGACDPTSGQCPPPRDPGLQPFIIRGDCTTDNTTPSAVTTCKELGIVQAVFDSSAKTITVPVPLALIHGKAGSKIGPGTNLFGGTISAIPAAFLSSSAMPLDVLTATKTFTVPKK
ncbi:MAG: hypothetical protein ABR579_02100 [Actinomycetota bacterium]